MAQYVPGTTPTGDLQQTQRYLREELYKIQTSIAQLWDAIDQTRADAGLQPLPRVRGQRGRT